MNFLYRKRLGWLFFTLLLLFTLIGVHLFNIQLVRGENYALKALEQDTDKVVLEDFSRGQILDCNLNSLTGGGMSYRVVVFPELITNKQPVVTELAKILGVQEDKLRADLNGAPCYLPYSLTNMQIKKIKACHFSGITIQPVYFRYGNYPLANHLIGYLGKIPSQEYLQQLNRQGDKTYLLADIIGIMGLEKYYDYDLKAGYPQRAARVQRDAHGNILKGANPIFEETSYNTGKSDLVLTIDRDIQRIVEQEMDAGVKKGAVVVTEVATGDIVAMASRPNFDPRHVEDYLSVKNEEAFLNRAVSLYQPGSVFKVLIAAAALEEGIVDENTVFTCLGAKDKLVKCWNLGGHGNITFSKAFAESCNPAFAQLGLKLGAKKIINYAQKMGLNNQEIKGYPVPRDSRQNFSTIGEKYNLVNSSIGQGPVLTTPVQITTLLNTIANNGIYKEPRLVKEIRTSGKTVKYFPPADGKQVVSRSTARKVQELLKLVTTEGVGIAGYVSGYGSAGKTGTAQISVHGGKVNAWFSGYAPLERPKYVATVLVEDSISGGESAAPVFRRIMERILSLKQ